MANIVSSNVEELLESITDQVYDAVWQTDVPDFIEFIKSYRDSEGDYFNALGSKFYFINQSDEYVKLEDEYGNSFVIKGSGLTNTYNSNIYSITIKSGSDYSEVMNFFGLNSSLTSGFTLSSQEMSTIGYDEYNRSDYTYYHLTSGKIDFSLQGVFGSSSLTLNKVTSNDVYKNNDFSQKFSLVSTNGLYITKTKAQGVINSLSYSEGDQSFDGASLDLTSIMPDFLKYSLEHREEFYVNDLIGKFGDKMIALLLKGSDNIKGTTANDILMGGLGNDKITGGAGKDIFKFDTNPNTKTNVDTITDFNVKDDTIQLENAIFKSFGSKTGSIASASFVKNTSGKAIDKNDYIIYETDTGKIFYDADGSGKGASVQVALIGKNLSLTNADFVLI